MSELPYTIGSISGVAQISPQCHEQQGEIRRTLQKFAIECRQAVHLEEERERVDPHSTIHLGTEIRIRRVHDLTAFRPHKLGWWLHSE